MRKERKRDFSGFKQTKNQYSAHSCIQISFNFKNILSTYWKGRLQKAWELTNNVGSIYWPSDVSMRNWKQKDEKDRMFGLTTPFPVLRPWEQPSWGFCIQVPGLLPILPSIRLEHTLCASQFCSTTFQGPLCLQDMHSFQILQPASLTCLTETGNLTKHSSPFGAPQNRSYHWIFIHPLHSI